MPDITLLSSKGKVHEKAGLNWGSNPNNHTTPIDAYIPIHRKTVLENPGLFDKKSSRRKEITFHWDDGTDITVLFEGNGVDGFPKQISSTPHKNILGQYMRNRLGVGNNEMVTMAHLRAYGRTTVTIERVDETNYNISFRV